MKHKFKYGYCLLQYQHNPWLKERLNIGVLVFGQSANYLRLKTRSWDGRILSSYPNLNRANFTEDLKQIQRSVTKYFEGDFKSPTLFVDRGYHNSLERAEHDALLLGRMLSPDMDSSYRWEAGGVGMCSSLEEKHEQLFQRFVSPYDKTRPAQHRTDSQVWSSFSAKLTERKLDRYIEADKTVRTDLGALKFQAAYQNGSLHVIQPLSFDLSDEEHVTAKAAKWGGYAQSVQSREKSVHPHYVIGRPNSPQLEEPFHRAEQYLQKILGEYNVVTEEKSGMLVDVIEEQMAGH